MLLISVLLCAHQTELEEAADLVLFLMDHTFLADDHLALNETTFTWPERIIPIIKMRYMYVKLKSNGSCASCLFLSHFDVVCDLILNRRTATNIEPIC